MISKNISKDNNLIFQIKSLSKKWIVESKILTFLRQSRCLDAFLTLIKAFIGNVHSPLLLTFFRVKSISTNCCSTRSQLRTLALSQSLETGFATKLNCYKFLFISSSKIPEKFGTITDPSSFFDRCRHVS